MARNSINFYSYCLFGLKYFALFVFPLLYSTCFAHCQNKFAVFGCLLLVDSKSIRVNKSMELTKQTVNTSYRIIFDRHYYWKEQNLEKFYLNYIVFRSPFIFYIGH